MGWRKMIAKRGTPKLQLSYPCRWVYKVIGSNQKQVRQAICELIAEREYVVTSSNSSATGKYHCMNLEMRVESEADRTGMYEALRRHPAIIMVI